MANLSKKLSTNVPGDFYVDSTCINCDTCRQLAPGTFREVGEYSSVYQQPRDAEREHLQAYQALVACPVGSIGTAGSDKARLQAAMHSFPIQIEKDVYYNGFTSEKSFGAQSYFVRRADGNWLIDSPRYVRTLMETFEHWGGIRYIFLSHEDDVAEAARYAKHFGATRIIHDEDRSAMPDAEWVITGTEPVPAAPGFTIIPVPGHTSGSMALLCDDRYLFTGDHMSWDRETNDLWLVTYLVQSERDVRASARRLLDFRFEWILPGHGDRIHLPEADMKNALRRLLERREGLTAIRR
jgi:glyoxylase-like metal-dependent hydrolase (beta-lactamase superfamily II)/ferredoxin